MCYIHFPYQGPRTLDGNYNITQRDNIDGRQWQQLHEGHWSFGGESMVKYTKKAAEKISS